MRAAPAASWRRSTREDSDRTLPTLPTALREAPRRSGGRSSGAGRRRALQESAFFQETTDDDEWARAAPAACVGAWGGERGAESADGVCRRGARAERGRQQRQEQLVPRIHVGTIDFPATRSVLWDRRTLADPAVVAAEQVLPRFVLTAAVVKELYGIRQRANASGSYKSPACYMRGEAIVPSQKRIKLVEVVSELVEIGNPQSSGGWWIPVHFTDDSDLSFSKDEYISAIKAVQHSYADDYNETLASRFQPRLSVSSSSEHEAQLDFQLELLFSPLSLKFSLIRNLPLLMTPLAASLAQHEFGSTEDTRKFGYLTLDRTRKAVPLLKMDPLVLQQPVVGIWVYGVNLSEEWDEEVAREQLADPYLYFSCLHYLSAHSVKERVGVASNTFLVALYPSGEKTNGRDVSPLPRFFECSFSERAQGDDILPIELYAHQKSCFAGLARFEADIELAPTATSNTAWEGAKQALDIPETMHLKHSQAEPETVETSTPVLESDTTSSNVAMSGPTGQVKSRHGEELNHPVHLPLGRSQRSKRDPRKAATDAPKLGVADNQADLSDVVHENLRGDDGAPFEHADSFVSSKAESVGWSSKESQVLSPKMASSVSQAIETEKLSRSRTRRSRSQLPATLDPANYRSCCKSQQLLAIQHQQILENQQRQLQEMQEQIAQLRKLLEATSTARQQSEESFNQSEEGSLKQEPHVKITNKGEDEREENRQWSHVGSELSRVSASLRSLSHAVENAAENDEGKSGSPLSSLELSSLSDGSLASDGMSSLSSSFMRSGIKFEESGVTTRFNPNDDGTWNTQENLDAHDEVRDEKEYDKEDQAENNGDSSSPPAVEDDSPVAKDSAEIRTTTSTSPQDNVIDVIDDEGVDDSDTHAVRIPPPRLLLPDAYLQQRGALVDHHGGCFTAPTPDLHSFCVPRIRFSLDDAPNASGASFVVSDSEDDDELRLIEQKYRKLMAA